MTYMRMKTNGKRIFNVILFRLSKCLAIADREVDH